MAEKIIDKIKNKSMVEYMKGYWEDEKKATKESYYYFFVFVGILLLDVVLIIGTKVERLSITGWTGLWFLIVLVSISLRDMYRHNDRADNIYDLLMKIELEKVNKEQKVTFEEINAKAEVNENV